MPTFDRAIAELFKGRKVVLGDAEIDAIAAHFEAADGPEADRWFRDFVSAPNPARVGLRDVYICHLRTGE